MRQKRFIVWTIAGAMFLLLIGLMPVNAHAGVCTTPPCVDSADIIDGEVKTSDIAAGAVTTGKLKNNAVTGAKVQDGSLTGTDIQDGSVTGTDIQDGSIGSADIQDGTVSGVDIGAGAVGTSQISDGAISSGKIAPGAVGSTQINNSQVQSRVMSNCAEGSSIRLVNPDGTVTCETDDNTTYTSGTGINIINGSEIGIADGGVGSTQINNTQVQSRVTGTCATGSSVRTVNQDGTVVCEADDNTTYTAGTGINIIGTSINISNGGVGSIQISDGAVTSAKIGTGAVGSSQIATGGVASTNIAPLSVGTSHLIDGNVTTAKIMNSAVGSTQISDGSITSADVGFNYAGSASKGGAASDLSCIGCVSQTELNFGGVKPAQRIVVAESGGDYTSIGAALAAISPSAFNLYVIDVMPGIYTEYITMKSYVHLRGAGQNVTIIQSPNIIYDVITISNLREVIISGFTIKGGRRGIYHSQSVIHIPSSSIIIENNLITGNDWTGIENAFGVTNTSIIIRNNEINMNGNHGIRNSSASPTIIGNIISINSWTGIYNTSASPTIINNIITDNTQYGIYVGTGSSALIKENTIKFNGMYGVYNSSDSVAFKVIHNWITDNGGTNYDDIYCSFLSLGGENVSFNVYNNITTNGTCSGSFNINIFGSAH